MALTDVVGAGTDRLARVMQALGAGRNHREALQFGAEALQAGTDLAAVQVWMLDQTIGQPVLTATATADHPPARQTQAGNGRRLRHQARLLREFVDRCMNDPAAVHHEVLPDAAATGFPGHAVSVTACPLEVAGRRVGALLLFTERELHAAEVRALGPMAAAFSLAAAGGLPGRGQTLTELEDDRRLMSAILDQLPVGVLVVDRDGTAIRTNRIVEGSFGGNVHGFAPEAWTSAVTEHVRLLDGTPLRTEDIPILRAIREDREIPSVELRIDYPALARDVVVNFGAAPVHDDKGEVIAGVAVFSDITPMRTALDQLAETKQQLDSQVADLTTLSGLFQRLSAIGELQPLLNETLAVLCEVLHTETGVILLCGPDSDELRFAATYGFNREIIALMESIPSEDLVASSALRLGRRVSVPDIMAQADRTPAYREAIRRAGIEALHVMPMAGVDGEPLGCIVPLFNRPRALDAREERILETCAQYAARLIANAQVHAREHDVAQTLQRSMLLHRLPSVPGTELAVRYRPGTVGMQAGGDWYDALVLPDGTLGLMIGDVVGHGVHAASIMGQLRSALRAYALVEWEEPAGVLDYLDHFVRSTGVGEMTTATFLTVDPATCRVRLANAGHYPPLLLARDGASYLEAGLNIPLGVSVNVETTDIEIPLEPGCVLLLYTDGLVERRGESVDDGLNRLRDAALHGPQNLEELCDHLLRECAPAGGSADDIAMLAVRVLG